MWECRVGRGRPPACPSPSSPLDNRLSALGLNTSGTCFHFSPQCDCKQVFQRCLDGGITWLEWQAYRYFSFLSSSFLRIFQIITKEHRLAASETKTRKSHLQGTANPVSVSRMLLQSPQASVSAHPLHPLQCIDSLSTRALLPRAPSPCLRGKGCPCEAILNSLTSLLGCRLPGGAEHPHH